MGTDGVPIVRSWFISTHIPTVRFFPCVRIPVRGGNEIRGVQDGMLRVSVTQAPEKGKANKAVVELLSKKLALKKSQIELLSGETSHQKRFLVRKIKPDELAERIRGLPM